MHWLGMRGSRTDATTRTVGEATTKAALVAIDDVRGVKDSPILTAVVEHQQTPIIAWLTCEFKVSTVFVISLLLSISEPSSNQCTALTPVDFATVDPVLHEQLAPVGVRVFYS